MSSASKALGEYNPMHEYGPDELVGPLRGSTAWWRGMGAQPENHDDGLPIQTKTTRKPCAPKKAGTPIRRELIERIRGEIAAGTYDTAEKWDAALDRLLDRLEVDD